MKALFIAMILVLQPQPSFSGNEKFVNDVTAKIKVLAEKHHSNRNRVTSETIDWLFNEKGFTESLSPQDIEILKDIVNIQCAIQTAKTETKKTTTRKIVTQPTKSWYDNVRLNFTYANGVVVPHYVRAYGCIDPTNPNNFIYNINEQTPEVQNLIRMYYPPR